MAVLSFLVQNWANLLVGGLVLAALAWAIAVMIRNRKKGKSACGCSGGCSGCPVPANATGLDPAGIKKAPAPKVGARHSVSFANKGIISG